MHPESLIAFLEQTADLSLAAEWDLSGIQVAGTRTPIRRLAVALDPLETTICSALDWEADFILTHHPLTLTPKLPNKTDSYRQVLKTLLAGDIWLYAAHTSLDVQTSGPVSWLARSLGLEGIKPILNTAPAWYWADLSLLKGSLDNLEPHCQDRGLRLVRDIQDREGLLCAQDRLPWAKSLLKTTFPGQAIPIHECTWDDGPCGFGVLGTLPEPKPWAELRQTLASLLPSSGWVSIGKPPDHVSCIGYCPGSGMDLAPSAFARGAQLFLSGDAKYHQAQDIESLGFTLDVGHFALEEAMMASWADELTPELNRQGIQVRHIAGHNPQHLEKT